MRTNKNYIDINPPKSSFLSCEKDAERIIKKLFVESQPYSDELKRLIIIDGNDCLTNRTRQDYKDKIKQYSVSKLIKDGYVRLQPRILMNENESMKSYIILSFDNFAPCRHNPHFRDCLIEIDVLCNLSSWDIGNFCQRPLKIVGYIDALLNESRLSGIGTINLVTCKEIILSEEYAGYCLLYEAVHGEDDVIEDE